MRVTKTLLEFLVTISKLKNCIDQSSTLIYLYYSNIETSQQYMSEIRRTEPMLSWDQKEDCTKNDVTGYKKQK